MRTTALLILLFPVVLLLGCAAQANEPFVTAQEGTFQLGGRRWMPHGTFYRPLYAQAGPGKERRDWIANYDPKAIAADLDKMKSLGLNSVRIMGSRAHRDVWREKDWTTFPTPATSYKARFDDFLDQLGRRGMKAMIFMHYTPRGSRWMPSLFTFAADRKARQESLELIQKTIRVLDLAGRPEIWAYEIDWEPHVGGQKKRNVPLALRLWNRWLIDQYGTVDAATKSWGFTPETKKVGRAQLLLAPTDEQVVRDGKWTKMSVAYRRFLIELINKKYAYLRRAIRQVDPNHLIAAQRCTFISRIPSHDRRILYPIRHTTAFLDFFGYTFSPHATWGLYDPQTYRTDDDRFTAQAFAIRYSKFGKPAIFTEYGKSTWSPRRPEMTPAHAELIQKLHYDRILRLARDYGIDGTLAWWWIGRRPMDKSDKEDSDWGVCRPDGTIRPCGGMLEKHTAALAGGLPAYKATAKLAVDEFAHANEADMYIQGKADFLKLVRAGKRPEVVSAFEGTTSATCPPTRLNGDASGPGPMRALDASLGVVEMEVAPGTWIDVQYGQTVRVATLPAKLRFTAANTGDVRWSAGPTATGRARSDVKCVVRSGGNPVHSVAAADVPVDGFFAVNSQVPKAGEVTIRLAHARHGNFGEVLRFRVIHAAQ